MEMLVDDFINSKFPCKWIEGEIFSVYLRKGIHLIDGKLLETLDVANIRSIPTQYRGKGYFKAFIVHLEGYGKPVYVECIHNPLLLNMLVKHGYTTIHDGHSIHAIKYPK